MKSGWQAREERRDRERSGPLAGGEAHSQTAFVTSVSLVDPAQHYTYTIRLSWTLLWIKNIMILTMID